MAKIRKYSLTEDFFLECQIFDGSLPVCSLGVSLYVNHPQLSILNYSLIWMELSYEVTRFLNYVNRFKSTGDFADSNDNLPALFECDDYEVF